MLAVQSAGLHHNFPGWIQDQPRPYSHAREAFSCLLCQRPRSISLCVFFGRQCLKVLVIVGSKPIFHHLEVERFLLPAPRWQLALTKADLLQNLGIRDQLQCTVPGVQSQRLALELLELWRSQYGMEGVADRSSPSLHDRRNVILRVAGVLHVPLLRILHRGQNVLLSGKGSDDLCQHQVHLFWQGHGSRESINHLNHAFRNILLL
mmetsp:Transcript_37600/g.88423  ORF Transcript_37600/g.88423 Transcript_37600/m.88423 type:complete len:206 (+) Transcript_37600:255-872(+)